MSHTEMLVSQASRIFPRAHARYGGRRGKGRKNTSGDYSMVFVSPAGICGGPMKLQQPCDIAERYVTCTQQGQRREKRQIKDVYSCTQEQIQAAITEAMRTLRYSALRPRQTKVVEHAQLCFTSTKKPSL